METKKIKKRTVIISGLVISALLAGSIKLYANAALKVDSAKVTKGPINRVIDINGNVETDKAETYYSEINGKVATVHVKEGDYVKKGDLLISFDEEKIDRELELADLKAQADLGSYNSSIQQSGRISGLYSEAKNNLAILDQQIAETETVIILKEKELLDTRSSLADEGAKLKISLIDWADEPDSEEYENLQKQVQTNAYEQEIGSDVVRIQNDLNTLNVMLAEYKEARAAMTSQKAASATGMLTKADKEKLEALKASNELVCEELTKRYAAAKDGIRAGFNGIISEIPVSEGSVVTEGSPLITVDSSDDIVLRLTVNKYDIVDIEEGQKATVNIKNKDYSGKVSRIERKTSKDAVGVGVEVTLDEPDDNIILGLECKVKVTSADKENALKVPADAVLSDENGDYTFILSEDKAVKTYVETGIRNEFEVEIVSGINENDTVIWNMDEDITDGMSVKVK